MSIKNRQEEILEEIANKHEVSIVEARKIWNSFLNTIKDVISKPDKLIDGQYVSDNFKVIHIDNFGKFIPSQKNIKYANKFLKK